MDNLEQVNELLCTPSGLVIVEHCPDDFSNPDDGLVDLLSFHATKASGSDAIDKMILINDIAASVIYNDSPIDVYLDAVAELAAIDPYHFIRL